MKTYRVVWMWLWLAGLIPTLPAAQTNLFTPGETFHFEIIVSRPLAVAQSAIDSHLDALRDPVFGMVGFSSNLGDKGTNSYRVSFVTSAASKELWYFTATALGTNDTALTLSSKGTGNLDGAVMQQFWNLLKRLGRGC